MSSFGIGGTNAHVVLEEAPPAAPSDPSRPWQVLLLSARTPAALERRRTASPPVWRRTRTSSLADVAYTLRVGRRPFAHRRAVLAATREDAVAALRERDPRRVWTAARETAAGRRGVAFLLPGRGRPVLRAWRQGLYDEEPVFRQEIDRCAELLPPHLGLDLREVLFARGDRGNGSRQSGLRALLGRGDSRESAARALLRETRIAQPAMFAVGYALARLWMSWGVAAAGPPRLQPRRVHGGLPGRRDGASRTPWRWWPGARRLIGELAPGAMLAVPLPEEETRRAAQPGAVARRGQRPGGLGGRPGRPRRSPRWSGGSPRRGVPCRRLQADQAFHSWMMEPVAGALRELLRAIPLAPPRIPYLSNVTGTWIAPAEATDPDYWVRHLRLDRPLRRRRRRAVARAGTGPARDGPRPDPGQPGAPAVPAEGRRVAPSSPRCATSWTGSRTSGSCCRAWAASGWPAWRSTGPASTAASGAAGCPCRPIRSSGSGTGSSQDRLRPRGTGGNREGGGSCVSPVGRRRGGSGLDRRPGGARLPDRDPPARTDPA